MSLILGSGARRSAGGMIHNAAWNDRDMDRIQMARHMRAMAVDIRVTGTARLRLEKRCFSELKAALRAAEEIAGLCENGGRALGRLREGIRLVESCALRALTEGGMKLPACAGTPRILEMMMGIYGNGGLEPDREWIMGGISAFDDVQALTMAEIWAAPCALRIVISRRLAETASEIVKTARERLAAERWVRGRSRQATGHAPAFFEHALRMASDGELVHVRERLEKLLARMDETPEEMIRRAHEQEAKQILSLERLLAADRFLDGLDWQTCFETLSAVEAELRCDPSGVYADMDDASREIVRRQVAVMARRLRLGEITIVRHAVDAALAAVREGGERQSTVCYWLATDEGMRALARRMGMDESGLPRLVPDPTGRVCVKVLLLLSASLAGLWMLWADRHWLLLPGIPIAWMAANAIAGRSFSGMFPPARLLGLAVEQVGEERRTLVVMPVLLSSPECALQMCRRLEAAGCLENDRDIRYLLLGDFADSARARCPEDAEIVSAARTAVRAMNERAGWEKYGYIHRPRTFLKVDRRWMGFDRKRGALMALNRLLMDLPGAQEAFGVEGAACAWLREGFRFVVTMDADTRFLPGTVRRLIGVMAHPLNRPDGEGHGYSILQPNMEMMPSACGNDFVRLFAGSGGLNTYPVSVSSFWQDLTGEGMFQGKGIYDVSAFYEALEGALPEGRILSHDLIEGAIARTGFVGDVSFYDGYPASLASVMKRLNRWTRGDWQLLPFVFSRKPISGKRRLTGAQRFRMADNLMRSLYAPALMASLILSVWLGSGNGLAASVLSVYLGPILRLGDADRLKWRRATAELAILPLTAWHMTDAILRTLWRLAVSGKHMLDWVTAEDAEKIRENTAIPGRVAAILLIPGLFRGGFPAAALALAALFLVGPGWIRDMERETPESAAALSMDDIAVLGGLARDTWHFFERYVPESGNGLPPDNVQMDPPVGPAHRTSPTNIGLYLISCLSAQRLGFIRTDEMCLRMEKTMETMARMEKWNGHLYNWYDTGTLEKLRPCYVSSVDSGNLAACLLLAAGALENMETTDDSDLRGLALRMGSMAREMDLAALYDEKRSLFRIGVDVDRGELSSACYDLLASESRILSYTAIMLGQVKPGHWSKLSRTSVATAGGTALAAWSGTLFEYLMPEIFMRAPAYSLLGSSNRTVVRAQKALAVAVKRPWGVSESGYYAFDASLNYQYRAFGLKTLALSGNAAENVVAPYACLLALSVDPAAVAENVRHMQRLGWMDEFGLFEAADYSRCGQSGAPDIVKSHMAHHQGMILCALCNALVGNCLCKSFMDIPQARAVELLLQEKPVPGIRLRSAKSVGTVRPPRPQNSPMARTARSDKRLCDSHMLYGGGATAFITREGAVHYIKDGLLATRFQGDLIGRRDGACMHVRDRDSAKCCIPGQQGRMRFDAGFTEADCDLDGVRITMKICLSPEDGTLYRLVTCINNREREARLTVADVLPVALAYEADVRAHSAFMNLFVESSPLGRNGILIRRRPRTRQDTGMILAHMTNAADVRFETDYEKLTGRMGDSMRPGGINLPFCNSFGTVLDPVSAISADIVLAPGETHRLHFAFSILKSDEDGTAWLDERRSPTAPDRAFGLAPVRARAMLDHIGINPAQHRLLQRLAALLLDGRIASQVAQDHRPVDGMAKDRLWETGISGDLPIILMSVNDPGQRENVHRLIRCHGFLRSMGLACDIVFVNDFAGGYDQPVRDMLSECISATHLRDLRCVPGGVWTPEGANLRDEVRQVLERAASVRLSGANDVFDRIGLLLAGLEIPACPERALIDTGHGVCIGETTENDNGFGGFSADGGYVIRVRQDMTTPAPWSNILANDRAGMLFTERGGGFFWHGNSRMCRLTPYGNDALREGWGIMLYLVEERTGAFLKLLPGMRPDMPFRVRYDGACAEYRFDTENLRGSVTAFMAGERGEARLRLEIENTGLAETEMRVVAFVNWQMGTDAGDNTMIRTWNDTRACFASGTAPGVGYFAANDPRTRPGPGRIAFLGRGGIDAPEGLDAPSDACGWTLVIPVKLERNHPRGFEFALGRGEDVSDAAKMAREFYGDREDRLREAREKHNCMQEAMHIHTPDPTLDRMANGFLIHQSLSSRIMGRTGLYQPGGAYGFRDQLQDMLAVLHFDPARVRAHLLRCAAHQFEDGDVMHWWHVPARGVRTGISDDMLFLPWVTAAYVKHTGDRNVLKEQIPYLENVQIPAGREDVYMEMRSGASLGSLHDHCMRAFRRASGTGIHGLALMGTGDWNDGMNRVGAEGRGESVWLSEFIAACAKAYGGIAACEADRLWLEALADRMEKAVESCGWDGRWYLRAYTDDGGILGGSSCTTCRIDAISQAWAVLAGLDEERCAKALDSAWEMLVDRDVGIVKLLTPPFELDGIDPGYIRGYPAGVRENGAQYTHGACWLLLAMIRAGRAEQAHEMLRMLLPCSHAENMQAARRYRVEPYVMAADVYSVPPFEGRGGWTWYTGSAAWMYCCILEMLGYERKGDAVRLNALLGTWPEAGLDVRFGGSVYRLRSVKDCDDVTLDGEVCPGPFIVMTDDGREHEACFPAR